MIKKPRTSIDRSERRAMLALLLLVITYLSWPGMKAQFIPSPNEQVDSVVLQSVLDQLRRPRPVRYFDPNSDTLDSLVAKGVPKKIAQNIVNYRTKVSAFKDAKQLQKLYAMDSANYHRLQSKIRITPIRVSVSMININTATSSDLVLHLAVKKYMATRIVKYRDLLGGFYTEKQYTEVYGINNETLRKLKSTCYISDAALHKLRLDSLSFKTLLRHPYLDYEDVKKVVGYLDTGSLLHLNDLYQIWTDSQQVHRILPYIDVEEVD